MFTGKPVGEQYRRGILGGRCYEQVRYLYDKPILAGLVYIYSDDDALILFKGKIQKKHIKLHPF